LRLLLDTHVFLWWQQGHRRLKVDVRRAIQRADAVFVSAASAWEAVIKIGLGKLQIPAPFSEGVAQSAFSELPVTIAHAEQLAQLPQHHTDPFDRLLIAQCRCEGLTVVTHDRAFEVYGVPVLWT